jgi:hypothetical protein
MFISGETWGRARQREHKVAGDVVVVLKLLYLIALERVNLPCKPCGVTQTGWKLQQ